MNSIAEQADALHLRLVKEPEQTAGDSVGRVVLGAGRIHENIEEVWDHIAARGAEIFNFGGELVLPLDHGDGGVDTAERELCRPKPLWLSVQLSSLMHFLRFDKRSRQYFRINCPKEFAAALLESKDLYRARPLVGYLECPTLSKTGRLIAEPGYDAETGLYLFKHGLGVRVPAEVSAEDVRHAREALVDLFLEFPFATEHGLSVAISSLLSALMRRLLGPVPMHTVTAHSPGTGKTTLCKIPSLVATGRAPPVMNLSQKEEESEKRLQSLLMRGPLAINIDNIEIALGGDFLCTAITEPLINPRALGTNDVDAVPTNVLLMASGNNLQVRGDIRRRSIQVTLDRGSEAPEKFPFARDIEQTCREIRGDIIAAALTIIRGYIQRDFPGLSDLEPFAGFGDWTKFVRGPLVWAGLPDPIASRIEIDAADIETERLRAVLGRWVEDVGDRGVTVAELIGLCVGSATAALMESLIDVAAARNNPTQIDARSLSHYLRAVEGRFVDGLTLRRSGKRKDRDVWRIARG